MHCTQARRSIVACAMLVTVALGGCGGGGGSAPVSMPPISIAPQQSTQTPLAASDFNDSIGINLHMTYVGSAYDVDFDKWSPILIGSGIKHVRDAICPYALAWCQDVESVRVNQLAAAGIRTDFLTSMSQSFSYVQSYAGTMNVTAAAEAFEGPNECDASTECGAWQGAEGAWQQQLASLAAAAMTIVGPSMVTQQGYSTLGNLSQFLDVGNIHDYVGTAPPESAIGALDHLSWVAAMSGNKPVWSTEFDYSTNPTYAQNGVPPVVQERYLPRLLLEHLRLGIKRTYIYQLFDFGPDGGAYMGLLDAQYVAKPAWTRLLQLMQLFYDNASSPRTRLAYGLDGDRTGTLDSVLFQRSDGTYLLAVWLAQSVYDAASHAVLAPATETLRLTLPAGVSSATLHQFLDYGVVQATVLNGSSGTFTVPVSSLLSVVEFRP